MKLYLSHGRIWTGTQADAKAAQGGKDFETREVPTDKPGLIAFLNDLINGEPTLSSSSPASQNDYEAPETITDPEDAPVAVVKNTPAPVTGDCPACNRSQHTAKVVANSKAVVNVIADLEDVNDMASLQRIIAKIKERHAILNATTTPLKGSEASAEPA